MKHPVTQRRLFDMLETATSGAILQALKEPSVVEILANPDGSIWIERQGMDLTRQKEKISPGTAERIIRLVATSAGQKSEVPAISAEYPETGERFQGVLPPVSLSAAFSIRKHAARVIPLEEYKTAGIMTEQQISALRAAVASRSNILVVGGTGSGKTTLANALLGEIANCRERIVILEDTRELKSTADNTVQLRTNEDVSMRELLHITLRMRPDRIIVGEVRGAEALDLLKSWNTGHPGGVSTIHADNASMALIRLEQLVQEATRTIPHLLIANTVNVIVVISGRGKNRSVQEIATVKSWSSSDGYQLKLL